MVYQVTISTPANTLQASRQRTVLQVTRGLIHRIEVRFRRNAKQLHRLQVFDGSFQYFPFSPGESASGDGETLGYDDIYLKFQPPWQFDVFTWNTDDTFAHEAVVRMAMETEQKFMARYLPTYAVDYQIEAIKRMELEQEAAKAEVISGGLPILGVGE